jgi:hypothetical protein
MPQKYELIPSFVYWIQMKRRVDMFFLDHKWNLDAC